MVNNSLANIVLLATFSSTVVSLNYEANSIIPQKDHVANLRPKKTLVESDYGYQMSYNLTQLEKQKKIDILCEFVRNILDNSSDVKGEYVKLVDENFWNLM